MASTPYPAHPCRTRALAALPTGPVADADLAEAWQVMAEAAPRYPHAHPGEELDALAWRAALLDGA